MQRKNASHLIMKSHNKIHQHQRKSCKMPTPDSEKYAYVKCAQKKKKKMCALVANCTKDD